MKPTPALATLIALATAACQTASPHTERLAPRAAESIDPRTPIPSEEPSGPASAALVAQLDAIKAPALASLGQFDQLALMARSAAAAAGPRQSESWIVAQQALSALVAAGAPVTKALGAIDALGGDRVGRLAAPDRKAIEAAAADLTTIEQRQAATIAQLSARIGN